MGVALTTLFSSLITSSAMTIIPRFRPTAFRVQVCLPKLAVNQRMFQQFMLSAQYAIEQWHGPHALASSELTRAHQDNGQGGLKKTQRHNRHALFSSGVTELDAVAAWASPFETPASRAAHDDGFRREAQQPWPARA